MEARKIDITKNEQHFPKINKKGLEDLRERIGTVITQTVTPWVTELNIDAIRHWAWGIGDDNPLWLEESYARNTHFGNILAPPSILFATDRVISGYCGGLPGVHAMFAGADWTWYKRLRRNTKISTEIYLKDLVEHDTAFAGGAIQQIYHGTFYNGEGDTLAECDSWVFRTERGTAREREEKYDRKKTRKVYTDEEIEKINEQYQNEKIRGKKPRYWEDVNEGDILPAINKGPMTVTGFIAFVQGWGGLYVRAHKIAFDMMNKHPGVGIPNAYNIPDVPERVHWEEELAKAVGAPGAYDYGPERVSWMSQIVTNWMGDEGFLHKLSAKIRRHNPEGDYLQISGKVTKKYKDNDKNCVDCELVAKQQENEISCIGSATVHLPLKNNP